MKLNSTIYQTADFKTSYEKACIDGNDIFYKIDGENVFIDASLIPFVEYEETCFNYFFNAFPKAHYIKFIRAAQSQNEKLYSKTIKIKHFDNNFCLSLHNINIEDYRVSLGKKTRMHLGQYLRRIEKELYKYGGGYYHVRVSEETRGIMNEIVDLNHERCESKGFKAGTDKENLFNTLKNYGILNYLTIGDRIVAGTIGSIYNNQFCLHVISHSNDYGKLNPGNAILYKTIENAIKQKIPIFNFLWGDCEYKSRFGAQEIQLFDYYVYQRYSDFFVKKSEIFCKKIIKKIKSLLKSIFRPPYHAAKWLYHHTFKRPPKSLGYIFMLHRVDDFEDGHLWCNECMKVTPDFLDEQLFMLERDYDIIPLSDVPMRLRQKHERKFIVFTMDDGYKDNFTKALPVFKKHNAPYTIFITTDFPDREALLWWYELEDLLLANDSVTLSNGVTYPCRTYEKKCDSFLKIREEILKLNQFDLRNELNRLFSPKKINWTWQCEKLCCTWDDIKSLKNEPLVTIGAHTKHHYNLKRLATESEVFEEVQTGVDLLNEKAGVTAEVFAYPFGSPRETGEREYKVLSHMLFSCSCIGYGGPCTKENAKNLSALPRIMFKQDFKLENLK